MSNVPTVLIPWFYSLFVSFRSGYIKARDSIVRSYRYLNNVNIEFTAKMCNTLFAPND